MRPEADTHASSRSRPPLWSIGSVIGATLLVPVALYSIAPEGPIREGDTVSSNGRHTVVMAHPTEYQRAGFESTCVLELNDPLIVMKRPDAQSDGPFRVQVQGKSRLEFPFCPPQAEILVRPHHVTQKPHPLSELAKKLSRMLLSRLSDEEKGVSSLRQGRRSVEELV